MTKTARGIVRIIGPDGIGKTDLVENLLLSMERATWIRTEGLLASGARLGALVSMTYRAVDLSARTGVGVISADPLIRQAVGIYTCMRRGGDKFAAEDALRQSFTESYAGYSSQMLGRGIVNLCLHLGSTPGHQRPGVLQEGIVRRGRSSADALNAEASKHQIDAYRSVADILRRNFQEACISLDVSDGRLSSGVAADLITAELGHQLEKTQAPQV